MVKWQSLLILWLLAAIHMVWWMQANPLPDGYQNEYLLLGNAMDLWGALVDGDVWHLRWYMYTGYWPWGLYAAPWPFVSVLGPGRLAFVLGNLIHLAVLLVAVNHLGRAVGGVKYVRRLQPDLENILHHLPVQRFLGGEIIVQIGLGQAGHIGNQLHRGPAKPCLGKDFFRCRQNKLFAFLAAFFLAAGAADGGHGTCLENFLDRLVRVWCSEFDHTVRKCAKARGQEARSETGEKMAWRHPVKT